MTSVLICPDPTCQAPARIIDQWVFDSTDGPVEHVKTRLRERPRAHPNDRRPRRNPRRRCSPPFAGPATVPAARRSRHLTTSTTRPAEGRQHPDRSRTR